MAGRTRTRTGSERSQARSCAHALPTSHGVPARKTARPANPPLLQFPHPGGPAPIYCHRPAVCLRKMRPPPAAVAISPSRLHVRSHVTVHSTNVRRKFLEQAGIAGSSSPKTRPLSPSLGAWARTTPSSCPSSCLAAGGASLRPASGAARARRGGRAPRPTGSTAARPRWSAVAGAATCTGSTSLARSSPNIWDLASAGTSLVPSAACAPRCSSFSGTSGAGAGT